MQQSNYPKRFGVPLRREEIINLLTSAYSNDFLEMDEYERRVSLAQKAKSIEELDALIADFPDSQKRPAPPSDHRQVPAERQYYPRVFSLVGDRKLSARDFKGGALEAISIVGDVKLDFSKCRDPEKVYDIRIVSIVGDVKILVPPGFRVEDHIFTLVGDKKNRRGFSDEDSADKVVRLRGFKLVGDIVIDDA